MGNGVLIFIIVTLIIFCFMLIIIGVESFKYPSEICQDKCLMFNLKYYEYESGGYGACSKCFCFDNGKTRDIYKEDGGQCLR